MSDLTSALPSDLQALADPAAHPDENGGNKSFSGVTRTLSTAGVISDWQVSEDILERGSDVHLATKYWDQDNLDMRTLPRDLKPYVVAWSNFRRDNSFKPLLIEHSLENSVHGVRGRADRIGTISGMKGVPDCVLEIASGNILPYKALQTAIYGYMHDPTKIFRRIGVELRAAGTYNVIEWPIAEYFDNVHDFLACKRVNEIKRRFRL